MFNLIYHIMNFGTSLKTCFSKYATFEGRARRSEFWWFYLAVFIGSCIPILQWFWGLAVIIPYLAVAARRLHDTGRSALNLLWMLLPVIGGLILLFWFVQDSKPGDNQYGANPKA